MNYPYTELVLLAISYFQFVLVRVWRRPLFRGFHNKDFKKKMKSGLELTVRCMKVSVVEIVQRFHCTISRGKRRNRKQIEN